jgi:hypothetical protein
VNALLLPTLLLVCGADETPEPKQLPGKDLAFVSSPLDKRWHIEYEKVLNEDFGKGITPEKNSNALLALAIGPTPEGVAMPPAYYKWLNVSVPPKDGEYFVGLDGFKRDRLGLSAAQAEALNEFKERAMQRAWVAKDCPSLAEWLKINEKPLGVVIEATKRPEFFNPFVSLRKEGEPSGIPNVPMPYVQTFRKLATALLTRATLRLGEKKFDDAWQDILACHRLGRLLTRATLLESLVGIAISQLASTTTLGFLERADQSSEQLLKRLRDLQMLPPVRPLGDTLVISERMNCLDLILVVRENGSRALKLGIGNDNKPTEEEQKAMEKLDWAAVLQALNKWSDRQVAATRLQDRAGREKAFDRIEEELKQLKTNPMSPEDFVKLLTDKTAGQTVGDVLTGIWVPGIRNVQQAHDLSAQTERNLHLAAALAAYHKDNNSYPSKLAILVPKYLATVPDDLYCGKSLNYKPNEKGYLLYSIGPDGRDDGGRGRFDDPRGDDVSVRMPLPEPK